MVVRFVLNGSPVEAHDVEPHVTLLQWLRPEGLGGTQEGGAGGRGGTKEGCAEGECGACAVALVVSHPEEPGSHFESVNSCLLPLLALEGRSVVSVEGVAGSHGALHPVQRALVEAGGSPCGYRTPGLVVR